MGCVWFDGVFVGVTVCAVCGSRMSFWRAITGSEIEKPGCLRPPIFANEYRRVMGGGECRDIKNGVSGGV